MFTPLVGLCASGMYYVTTIPIPNLDFNEVLSQFLLNLALTPIGRSSDTYVAFLTSSTTAS